MNFNALTLIALLVWSGASLADEPCNCVAYAIEALKSVGIKLKTIPSIAVNDWCKHPGCYRRGVVNIKDINDCRTLIHEFVHHAQWLHDGDALDNHENWRREMQAAVLTMHAESEYGACKP